MARYEVGFIYGRSFVQKRLDFSQDCYVLPLPQTGSAGEIHDVRRLLEVVRFPYSQRDLEQSLKNFSNTGHCTLVYFGNVEAEEFVAAIDLKEREAENVIGSICVASANPAVPLCAFATSASGSGLTFH